MTVETALIKDDKGLFEPVAPLNQRIEHNLKVVQSSPYPGPEHLLQLARLEEQPYRDLAIALRSLEPVDKIGYALNDYTQTFNFDQVVQKLQQVNPNFAGADVYIVAFKSKVWEETRESSHRRQVLADIDKASHAEANESGGLLKYWFGTPDQGGHNLATCFWRSRDDAKRGGGGQAHREGMRRVRGWFEQWRIEEYRFTIHPNASSFEIVKY